MKKKHIFKQPIAIVLFLFLAWINYYIIALLLVMVVCGGEGTSCWIYDKIPGYLVFAIWVIIVVLLSYYQTKRLLSKKGGK